MHKTRKEFRLSQQALTALAEYSKAHGLNTTESLERILSGFLSPEANKVESSSSLSDLFKCRRRIEFEGKNLCVNRPPKAVELLSLEICNVCKAANIGLEDRTKVDIPTEETFDRARQPITDPKTDMSKAAMRYCRDGGLFVFAKKCENCRDMQYAVWYDCQIEKYREKGEQIGRNDK